MNEHVNEHVNDHVNQEMVDFFRSIVRQFYDVKELKAKYLEEDRLSQREALWKRPLGERGTTKQPDKLPVAVRYAPDIGPEEAERIYNLLPSGRFTVFSASTIIGVNTKAARRIFYWLAKRRLIKYDSAAFTYSKRTGSQKGSFKAQYLFEHDRDKRSLQNKRS